MRTVTGTEGAGRGAAGPGSPVPAPSSPGQGAQPGREGPGGSRGSPPRWLPEPEVAPQNREKGIALLGSFVY